MDKKIDERLSRIEMAVGIGEGMDKFFTYPAIGGVTSLPKGDNIINFAEGRAVHADDKSKFYSLSETLGPGEFVRSYAVEPNRDMKVYTDQNRMSVQTVKAGQYFRLPHQRLKKLYVVCTEPTDIYVLGHTHPDGVPRKFSVTTETMATNNVHRLSLSTTENSVDFNTVAKGFYMTYIDCDAYLDFDRTASTSTSPFFKTATSLYFDFHCRVVHGITSSGSGMAYLISVY